LMLFKTLKTKQKNELKTDTLAPIVVEILMSRGSAHKIVTDSGK
jgi:hypothetical protein